MTCQTETFCENFIFLNNVKRHVCDVKNLRLEHDFNYYISKGQSDLIIIIKIIIIVFIYRGLHI